MPIGPRTCTARPWRGQITMGEKSKPGGGRLFGGHGGGGIVQIMIHGRAVGGTVITNSGYLQAFQAVGIKLMLP